MKLVKLFFAQTRLIGFLGAMIVALVFVLGWGFAGDSGFSLGSVQERVKTFIDGPPEPTPVPPSFQMAVGDLTECDGVTCKLALKIDNNGAHRVAFNLKVGHPQFRWVDATVSAEASTIEDNQFAHDYVLSVDDITRAGNRTIYLWMRGLVQPSSLPGIKLPHFKAERKDNATLPFEIGHQKFWLAPDGTFEKVEFAEGQDWFDWVSNRLQLPPFAPTDGHDGIRHAKIGRDAGHVEKLFLGIEPPEGQVKHINIYADRGICAYLPSYFASVHEQSGNSQGHCRVDFNSGNLSLRNGEKTLVEIGLCQEAMTEDGTNVEVTILYSAENKPDFTHNVVIPIETSMLDSCRPQQEPTTSQ